MMSRVTMAPNNISDMSEIHLNSWSGAVNGSSLAPEQTFLSRTYDTATDLNHLCVSVL